MVLVVLGIFLRFFLVWCRVVDVECVFGYVGSGGRMCLCG